MFNWSKHEVDWRYKHRERDKKEEEDNKGEIPMEQNKKTEEQVVKLQAGARGIDVSENNGTVDWDAVVEAGVEFVIIRLGYGRGHLDEEFYDNVQGALSRGLQIGVYYYGYARNHFDARDEAEFLVETLQEAGLTMDKLPMGVWYDMEDADGWKEENNCWDGYLMSEECASFIEVCRANGYDCGVYASLSWLVDVLDVEVFGENVPIWCAQWDSECDWEGAKIWQDCDDFEIDGRAFDGNILMIP